MSFQHPPEIRGVIQAEKSKGQRHCNCSHNPQTSSCSTSLILAFEKYVTGKEHDALNSLDEFPAEYQQDLLDVGIEPSEKDRSGSFLQQDCSVVFSTVKYKGLELMSTTDAMKKHDWLEDYLWKAVQVDTDKYTAEVELE